jgi:hypothetical protein
MDRIVSKVNCRERSEHLSENVFIHIVQSLSYNVLNAKGEYVLK